MTRPSNSTAATLIYLCCLAAIGCAGTAVSIPPDPSPKRRTNTDVKSSSATASKIGAVTGSADATLTQARLAAGTANVMDLLRFIMEESNVIVNFSAIQEAEFSGRPAPRLRGDLELIDGEVAEALVEAAGLTATRVYLADAARTVVLEVDSPNRTTPLRSDIGCRFGSWETCDEETPDEPPGPLGDVMIVRVTSHPPGSLARALRKTLQHEAPPHLVALSQTRRLFMQGTHEQLKEVALLVSYLDVPKK